MSPQQPLNGKRDQSTANTNNNAKVLCPPPLKINKDSHFIRKSSSSNSASPSSSSSSTSSQLVNGVAAAVAVAGSAKPPPQRHPVIIYTHSPKIIHTHPRDFMALVQKLTGMSRSDEEASPKATKSGDENNKGSKVVVSDDNESSSVVTEENCCSGGVVEGQVNSCFAPPIFEPPPPPPQLANSYLTNIPVYRPNSTEFLCSNQPFFNYDDSLLFGAPNIQSLASTNSTLNGINDFCEYGEY
ncbi:VQ motif-containing protein 20-like [Cucurbita maxima]|uniref:VQ motif-containing protein 20-like n=1 Tax=Cucurbita maxima TaxID=3661 RepID=A0A6J1L266_CUCMA|nr:VQ motif-containing protein 20-like [Cucurbita maxima]